MSKIRSGLFRLTGKVTDGLIEKAQARRGQRADLDPLDIEIRKNIPEKYYRFDKYPKYELLVGHKVVANMMNIENPFFKAIDGKPLVEANIDGKVYLNFSSYNYLGLNGHPRVSKAAIDAIEKYGTSVSGSRLVSGERSLIRGLEQSLAELHGVDECLVFVSGHATNVTTIGYLFDKDDLIIHDEYIHNSAVEGVRLSGATRLIFPHNDFNKLDQILQAKRHDFKRVLVIIEGLYGMDGDYPNLPEFIQIKKKHKAFLMIDEAHSVGVMGKTGRGIGEHFGIDCRDVDIWMGTLSKTFAGCGGYIAGEYALVEHLRLAAPGQVYSVGISPPVAAACHEAIRVMKDEPERVAALKARSLEFYKQAKKAGLPVGNCSGFAVVPIICRSSKKAVMFSNRLFEQGIYALPIIYPAVPENVARLRFFLSAMHTSEHIHRAVSTSVDIAKQLKII